MKMQEVRFEVAVYESIQGLNEQDRLLMEKAMDIRQHAYAPYSRFLVGAAVLMANGEIITGNNQENASYPSGLCAERVAVFYAGAQFPDMEIKAIAISATSETHRLTQPVAPCGNCRQSLAEYENKQKSPIAILFTGESGEVVKSNSIGDLLPFAFNSSFL